MTYTPTTRPGTARSAHRTYCSTICWAPASTTEGSSRYGRPHERAVHLHHAQGEPVPPSRQGGAEGHLAVVLPRGQDRRAGGERGGQVVAAADHGRGGRRLHRRGPADPGVHRGDAGAGAAARPGQGRGRKRGRRRGPRGGAAGRVRRGEGRLGRSR